MLTEKLITEIILGFMLAGGSGVAAYAMHLHKEEIKRNAETHKRLGERAGNIERKMTEVETRVKIMEHRIDRIDGV